MTAVNNKNVHDDLLAKILDRMVEKAAELKIRGVAVVGVYKKEQSLISRAQVCGLAFNEGYNMIGIAYAKLAEMCHKLSDSGSHGQPILHGEYGYVGGSIKQAGQICFVAAFRGGSGPDDLAVSRYGLEIV
jgi:hypothetical protein